MAQGPPGQLPTDHTAGPDVIQNEVDGFNCADSIRRRDRGKAWILLASDSDRLMSIKAAAQAQSRITRLGKVIGRASGGKWHGKVIAS